MFYPLKSKTVVLIKQMQLYFDVFNIYFIFWYIEKFLKLYLLTILEVFCWIDYSVIPTDIYKVIIISLIFIILDFWQF